MKQLLFLVLLVLNLFFIGARPPKQVIQSGTETLYFNGQDVAMEQVDLDFSDTPVIVCSVSNEWVAGALVGCQALSGQVGSVSVQLPYTTTLSIKVNWVAVGSK